MRTKSAIPLICFAVVLAAAFTLLFSGRQPLTAASYPTEQVVWAGYWTTAPGFISTLEMKNNRISETLTVRASLYFASGEEYPLEAFQLGPRETAVVSINRIIEALPPSVAARAGNEGTLEVEFDATTPSALMGSVSVTNPDRGIAWNFFMYPVRSTLPKVPVTGVFWFYDERTEGFIAVHNASEAPMSVWPRFWVGGQSYALSVLQLSPGQGYKLDLRKELRRLGLARVKAGGLEFTYEGTPDALKAHGVLFNNHGFSAEIDFNRLDSSQKERTFALRTPRFAVGAADPVLGLPQRTRFEPFVALHNFNQEPLSLSLAVGYPGESGWRELEVAVSLPAGDTKVLELHQYLGESFPAGISWASLEVRYAARQTGLAASMVSVSKGGEHSIRSVLNWVEATTREGWYWRADADHTTLLGIFNADSQEARVRVSLDYYWEGVRSSYELPPLTLPGRGSQLVDVGQIIAAGVPDRDGHTIPAGLTFGGYRVRKVAGNPASSIVTEALVVDRRARSFLAFYNTGCCYQYVYFQPPQGAQFEGFVDGAAIVTIYGQDICSGFLLDISCQGSFSSGNNSVARNDGCGLFSFVGAGQTEVFSNISYYRTMSEACFECIPQQVCNLDFASSFNPVVVRPTVSISGPDNVPLRASGSTGPNTITLTANGNPPGGSLAWTSFSGNVSLTNASSATVTVTAQSASTSVGDVLITVTYTLNQQSNTASKYITVQKPTRLGIVPGTDSTTSEGLCTTSQDVLGCGVTRTFVYQVLDQWGSLMQVNGMEFWDSIQPGTPNTCSLASFQTTCTPSNTGPCGQVTFGGGRLNETLFICAAACRTQAGTCTTGCSTSATQTWNINGFSLTADVKQLSYQCDHILVNGQ